MFLNAFDLETSNGARNLELRAGFFPGMGLDVDLLAISANGLHDESHHDTVVKELKSSYGLKLESVSKAVDLSGSLLNSWVSQPLELHPVTSNRDSRKTNSHFQRVAVVGAGLDAGAEASAAWDAFNRLFSLLAILPMQGILTTETPAGETRLPANNIAIFPPNRRRTRVENTRDKPYWALVLLTRADRT